MTLSARIELLALLGKHLIKFDDQLELAIRQTYHHNRWFTIENIKESITAICTEFLSKEKLEAWSAHYEIESRKSTKSIGLVMAGNIPMVGFYDWLCVFISGHISIVKLSDKDKFLLPHVFNFLSDLEPSVKTYIQTTEFLKDFDAVIATGSNNSARYFESYFGKYPNIIRRNRTSVAILDGSESREDLVNLGKDIFMYFGLGCRNVSKIYVPKGFDFERLMEVLHDYKEIVLHHKYKNNFDYNFSLLILNQIKHYSNGCLLVYEDVSLHSRIAGLHYEIYHDIKDLSEQLKLKSEEIQCVAARRPIDGFEVIPFGETQKPGLADYADGVDTMKFLMMI